MRRSVPILVMTCLFLIPATATAVDFPASHTTRFVGDWWDVDSSPDFDANLVEEQVSPGEEVRVSVVLTNRGEIVAFESVDEPATAVETNESEKEFAYEVDATEARALTATIRGGNGLTVIGGTSAASGTVRSGESVTLPFTLRVDRFTEPGLRNLPLEVRYRYLKDAAVDFENGQYEPAFHYVERVQRFNLTVRVEERAVLTVTDIDVVDGAAGAGRRATLMVQYRNDGTETATGAEARLLSSDPLVNGSTGGWLGTLAPGEEATATYRVEFGEEAPPGPAGLSTEVTYEDEGGNEVTAPSVSIPVELERFSPRFSASSNGSLPIGGDGTVTLTVENLMEGTAAEAEAILHPQDPFSSEEPRAYLGDIGPGESVETRFRLQLEDETLAKQYPLRYTLEYLDEDGRRHRSRELSVPVTVEAGAGLQGLSTWLLGLLALIVAGAVAAFLYLRR